MLAVCAAGIAFGVAQAASAADANAEAQAKAIQAVRAKLDEIQAQSGFAPIVSPINASARDSETAAKLRAAVRQVTDQPLPPRAPEAPKAQQAGAAAGFPPLQAPPVAIPVEKQQQLDALLQQYRNDQVTAEQYQAARKKILGRP